MSALNASEDSTSKFLRSKVKGLKNDERERERERKR
jgi:hypothetical protein